MGGVKKLFGMKTPKPPTIVQAPLPPPVEEKPIPQADTEAIAKSKKLAAIQASQRSGRASTILSESDESLG